jgi:hypothetical protein
MKIMAFIEEEKVVEKTLKHLELWEMKARPPSRAKTPSVTIYLDASDSHLPRQHRGLVFVGDLIRTEGLVRESVEGDWE